MKVLVMFWRDNEQKPSLGAIGRVIWWDLKTWSGIVRRVNRYFPRHNIEIEILNPNNPYSKPIETRSFTTK